MTKNLGKPGSPDGPPIDSKGVRFSDLDGFQKGGAVAGITVVILAAVVASAILVGGATWLAIVIWQDVLSRLT